MLSMTRREAMYSLMSCSHLGENGSSTGKVGQRFSQYGAAKDERERLACRPARLTEVSGPAVPDAAHGLRQHVHLLEVDELAVRERLVALMREGHVYRRRKRE